MKDLGATSGSNTLPQDSDTLPVVGIGASAGGLEALEKLFEAIPPDLGAAYVVVQHLSPDHPSMMVNLLARHATIQVLEARDGALLEPDTAYILPPGKVLSLQHGHIRLQPKSLTAGVVYCIDIMLHSLARDRGPQAIGVVLSGTGSDGAQGIRAIHEAGGLVLVQEPATAQFDGMPQSAIDTGVADAVLPPEDMAARLRAYIQRVPLLSEDAAEPVQRILELVCQRTGSDFTKYKRATVMRRLERRLHVHQLQRLEDYAVLLEGSTVEADLLKRELLISVTAFFRDADAFAYLGDRVVPEIVEQVERDQPVRIWVCGCATGEEAYSIAILFAEHAEAQHRPCDLKIFATDVDARAIDIANRGIYPESSLADMPATRRDRWFIRGRDGWRVSTQLRQQICFAVHDVLKDPPFARLDLMCCRNVLIYMEPVLQQTVLQRVAFALRPGGFLFLGGSETPRSVDSHLKVFSTRHKLYRKRIGGPAVHLGAPTVAPAPRKPAEAPRANPVERALFSLLDTYCPPTILVDHQGRMAHNFGPVDRYLSVPRGHPTLELVPHLPRPWQAAVSVALHRVLRDGEAVRLAALVLETAAGRELVDLQIRPLAVTGSPDPHLLVHFETGAVLAAAADLNVDSAMRDRIALLEDELRAARAGQQAAIEEQDTATEELQATNEELIASNEELQSTNEELQSVNEELYTVNAELKAKYDELVLANSDLDNLIRVTDVGTIFIDTRRNIRRFTPAACLAVNLRPQDIGRPIGHISINIGFPDFLAAIDGVLASGCEIKREVTCRDGQVLLARLIPFLSAKGETDGVVVTFVDITALKAERDKLQLLIDALPHELVVVDEGGEILLANEEWRRFAASYTVTGADLGSNYYAICRAPAVAEGVRAVLHGGERHVTTEYLLPDLNRWFRLDIAAAPRILGGAIVSHTDVTEQRIFENRLRLADQVIENSREAILVTDADERIVALNPAFTTLTGFALDEVAGQTPRILSSGRHDKAFYAGMWRDLQEQGYWHGELWNRRKDGATFPQWISISTVRDSAGRVTNYVSIAVDITERKAVESRLLRMNGELEEFAYVASHDMQEPLRMIISYLQLLERRLGPHFDTDTRDFMDFVLDAARRLSTIIHDLLDYSRVDRLGDPLQPVAADRAFAEALNYLRPALAEAGGDVIVEALPRVLADETQLIRLFVNILGNAVKYRRPDVPPHIHVSAACDTVWCTFAIADNGIGISPEYYERIFRIFQRLHPYGAYEGTGIGLAVCKKIVDRHGGSVWVDSNPEGGCTFRFSLRLVQPE